MRLPALTLLIPAFLSAADTAPARLGQGINAYRVKDYSGTIQQLRGLQPQIPKLQDYVVYHLASSEVQTGDIEGAVRDLTAYRARPLPASPLAGRISLLHARALLDQKESGAAAKALDILQTDYRLLPQPDGDFALALAYEALGEKLQSALTYEKVYYGFPNTDLAAQSSAAMDRLRSLLNRDFPLAPPRQQLERCQKWLDAREFDKARQEYAVLASTLPEPDRDQAKVGIGAADYLSGDAAAALRYLTGLRIARSEADARRLYFMVEAAKKTGDDAAIAESVRLLERQYSLSPWRLKALLAAGNRYLASGERDKYTPLFKAASDTFPADSATAACHWRIAWDAYLAGTPERLDLLREQAERYPSDSRAGTALYFLGRLEEKNGHAAEARAYYERVSRQFPHYFYAVLARERIKDAQLAAALPQAAIVEWLDGLDWPEHRDYTVTVPNAATRLRIDRARLLMTAGLPDVADAELRFGARTADEQPHLLAMELARSMPTPFHALRIMKSFNADYLALPFDKAPLRFWQMLFPLPYKDDVVRNAKSHDLDPYSVAALIRQETEFNPAAHSPANAYGLMQLVPATGRQMAREQGIRLVGSNSLLDPVISIRLGTHYLREQLNNWGGDWIQTLAAYNAGPGRVRQWLGSIDYKEPAEFVESIPFNETREYVQAVLRNADMYRTIYGERHPQATDSRDFYDVPPVNLASLPLAARTPAGGLKTRLVSRPPARRGALGKKPAKGPVTARNRAAGSVTKKSAAGHAKAAGPRPAAASKKGAAGKSPKGTKAAPGTNTVKRAPVKNRDRA